VYPSGTKLLNISKTSARISQQSIVVVLASSTIIACHKTNTSSP